MDAGRLIVGDIGGTNTRLALAHRGAEGWRLNAVEVTPTQADVPAVVEAYWRARGAPLLEGAAFCGAGPLQQGRIQLTNHAAAVDPQALSAVLGLAPVRVLNDFEAIAWCLPALQDGDCALIHPGRALAGAPQLVLGPGTGFGAAAYLPTAGGDLVLAGEAGHARLASGPLAEQRFWQQLEVQFGSLSIEKVLSGGGLARLHQVLASVSLEPAEVANAAWQGKPLALQAVEIFTRTLARVAADLALVFGARGGVFIAGGMVPKWGAQFPVELFAAEFSNRVEMRELLQALPVSVITTPYPALLGLASAWQRGGRLGC